MEKAHCNVEMIANKKGSNFKVGKISARSYEKETCPSDCTNFRPATNNLKKELQWAQSMRDIKLYSLESKIVISKSWARGQANGMDLTHHGPKVQ